MRQASATIYRDIQEDKAFWDTLASIHRKVLPPWLIDGVFDHYQVSPHHEAEVVRFLCAHRYLLPILLDAVPHITRVFGQSAVYLEVEHDPDEGFEELFGVVMVEAEPEKALNLLGRFDQEWFAKVVRRTRSRLNFTVDTVNDESV